MNYYQQLSLIIYLLLVKNKENRQIEKQLMARKDEPKG